MIPSKVANKHDSSLPLPPLPRPTPISHITRPISKSNANATRLSPHDTNMTCTNGTPHVSLYQYAMSTADLPPPGPSHYAARRALWLTTSAVPRPTPLSASRKKLEQLLSRPGAVKSDEIWEDGLEKVWKGLVAGGRLKRRLPMTLVIKIIHAGWLRDPDTWPAGAVVPDSDDDIPGDALPPAICSNGMPGLLDFKSSITGKPFTAARFGNDDVNLTSKYPSGLVIAD